MGPFIHRFLLWAYRVHNPRTIIHGIINNVEPRHRENRDTGADNKLPPQIFLLLEVSAPHLSCFKGPLCNTSEITIKILAMEKEQEHINENSCAYAEIVVIVL